MDKAKKFVCIHGHFYQPPRENAWLEVVELQDSAMPFHDWNERINFECYAPNTAARILDDQKNIVKIINNYGYISFNFGPTLLSWMEKADPETYAAILDADKDSQSRFGQHGSAIAQAHSHLILPLANERDKQTQIHWGIKDFEHRFDRLPEGMWLAETAADSATLEALVDHGIKYTILAPRQAKAFRKIGEDKWSNIHNEQFDTRRPYSCRLPSGRSIALFFYDGDVAQGVAFKGLLNNGRDFANHINSRFDQNEEVQLVNVATDGESYGHHHRYGEMALAACLNHLQSQDKVSITNYGEFLERFPPSYEMQIHEKSSWSCAHGVERWRSNCGCQSGGKPGWDQSWRGPLREALDWLREELIKVYEKEAKLLLKNPWGARDDFIQLLLDRSEENVRAFTEQHLKKKGTKAHKIKMLRLLEMQRNAMLMYTSCGWFFDEVSGIETNQILQYALRAIDYAEQVSGKRLHEEFVTRLEKTPSNVFVNAAESYLENVIPARVGLGGAGMHFAVASLFAKDTRRLQLFNYHAKNECYERFEAGKQRIAFGRTIMRSGITQSEKKFSFAVLYLGQQNIIGYISVDLDRQEFDDMLELASSAFRNNNLNELLGILKRFFGSERYSFANLFRDEKRKILKQITSRNMRRAESDFREIYEDNYQLMASLHKSHIPVPKAYQNVVQFIVNADLHRYFEQDFMSIRELQRLSSELEKWDVQLSNEESFMLAASERIFYEIRNVYLNEVSIDQIKRLNTILQIIKKMGLELDIWKSQNFYFSKMQGYQRGDWVFASEEWRTTFLKLGHLLGVKVDQLSDVTV